MSVVDLINTVVERSSLIDFVVVGLESPAVEL